MISAKARRSGTGRAVWVWFDANQKPLGILFLRSGPVAKALVSTSEWESVEVLVGPKAQMASLMKPASGAGSGEA